MSQLINAVKISKAFAGRPLFENLSFGLESKDRIGLVGPNGAGKSTLLKILAKQIEPDSGQIVTQKGLRIGFLDQAPNFEKHETIISALTKGHDDVASAYEWISKLNLLQFPEDTLLTSLSGGWQKRVALARELIKKPDLLLLDEPTNHLDVSSILWLEDFLNDQQTAYLMITHDRLFLQRTTTRIWDLDPQNPDLLFIVDGDYSLYVEEKENMLAAQRKQLQVNKNILRRETEWLRRGAKARQTKQKARGQAAAELKNVVSDLKEKNRDRNIALEFTQASRQPQKLVQLENISYSVGDLKLWEDFTLLLTPKSRVALLGDNGTGKSTLLKIICGNLTPQSGTVKRAPDLKISYFEQSKDTLNPKLSTLKNICPDGDYVDFQGEYIFAKSYLERFQFTYQQMDLPVEKLSGGEKSRLRLAQMMLTSAQVLILDEPTNDLDMRTLNSLQESLANFAGAVILVTHDRFFMDSIANEIIAINDKYPSEPRSIRFADYWQWEEWMQNQAQQQVVQNKIANASSSGKKLKLSFKDKFEYDTMETEIAKLEADLAECQKQIESPETAANAELTNDLYIRIQDLSIQLDQRYTRWAELEKMVKETDLGPVNKK